jgi:hypothetical protein
MLNDWIAIEQISITCTAATGSVMTCNSIPPQRAENAKPAMLDNIEAITMIDNEASATVFMPTKLSNEG